MRRWLLIVACLLAVGSVGVGQETLRLRRILPQSIPLILTISSPTEAAGHTQTGASIILGGSAVGGATSITWTCSTCSPTSGTMLGTSSWTTPETGTASTVFQDTFTTGGNDAVTTHAPTPIGSGWTEVVDTAGTNSVRLYAALDFIGPETLDTTGDRLLVQASPSASATNYDVSAKYLTGNSINAGSEADIIFGYQGTNTYCGVAIRSPVQDPDVILFERTAGVVTVLDSDNVGPVSGQTYAVEVRGTSLTVTRNGTTILTGTSSVCDNASAIGLGWGEHRTSGAVIDTQVFFDDFTVVDQDGTAVGIGLSIGAHTIEVCALRDPTESCDTIVVTRTGADTTDPTIAITSPTASPTYATSTANLSLAGTMSDNVAVTSVSCACATCVPTSHTATLGSGTWNAAAFTLASGANTVTCTALDAAGNDAADAVVATFTAVDSTDPTVTITSPTSGATHTATTTPLTVAGTASDNVSVTRVECVNAAGGGVVLASGTTAWSCPINLLNGSNAVTVTAFDEAGNDGTDLLTVTFDATLTIVSSATLPPATEDLAYSVTLAATGGTLPYTWDNNGAGTSVNDADAECAGLTISSAGVVSGTPTTAGTCSFTSRVEDDAGSPATDTQAHTIVVTTPGSGPHAFFEALLLRSDLYRAVSLRPQAGVTNVNSPYYQGMFTEQNSPTGGGLLGYDCDFPEYYQPASDTHPQKQDAAKFSLPPFATPGGCETGYTITNAINNSVTKFAVGKVNSNYGPPGERAVRVDDEVMDLRACTVAEGGDGSHAYITGTLEICVIRGRYGTAAASHSAGASIKTSTNSFASGITRIRMGTVVGGQWVGTLDGHTYLITWDEFWTDSYMGVKGWNNAQKTYQVQNGSTSGGGKLWETRLRFDGGSSAPAGSRPPSWSPSTSVAAIDVRPYNSDYAGIDTWSLTNGNTMGPSWVRGCAGSCLNGQTGTFSVKPNTWVRFWIKVVQRSNDFDLFTLWVADENTDAVMIFQDVKMSVSGSLNPAHQTMRYFDFEKADSSTSYSRGGLFDLISYARNWAVLQDPPSDLVGAGLMIRPVR